MLNLALACSTAGRLRGQTDAELMGLCLWDRG
jgi:hypothetical protein